MIRKVQRKFSFAHQKKKTRECKGDKKKKMAKKRKSKQERKRRKNN